METSTSENQFYNRWPCSWDPAFAIRRNFSRSNENKTELEFLQPHYSKSRQVEVADANDSDEAEIDDDVRDDSNSGDYDDTNVIEIFMGDKEYLTYSDQTETI